MKGLIEFLNWQDQFPSRIETIKNDYPENQDFTVEVEADDIIFAIKGHPEILDLL